MEKEICGECKHFWRQTDSGRGYCYGRSKPIAVHEEDDASGCIIAVSE